MSRWTLFSNHGHVLLFLAQDPEVRLRDVARAVGITERAVQKIVRDLQDAGMLTVSKHGRRNRYRIHMQKNLRHDLESHCTIGQLVGLVERGRLPARVATAIEESVEAPVATSPTPANHLVPEPKQAAVPEKKVPEAPADADEKPASGQAEAPSPDRGEQGSLF